MGFQVWLNGYEDSYSQTLFIGKNCFAIGGCSCSVDTVRRGSKFHHLRGKESIKRAEIALERFFMEADSQDRRDRMPAWFNPVNR
jgi:hypothetical protein